ncbi:MAG: hypothetical protein ABSF83_09190 [Nitrososphaerales archaeon]|jgi:hypothetical protein
MTMRSGPALVIALSLITFFVPNAVGVAVWALGDGLPEVLRSLTAILGWVVAFGGSSMAFWRLVVAATRGGGGGAA